jgi:hypothetical protein
MNYILSRLSLLEISGAFGDLGTLIPITISMTKKNVLHPCVSFFWGGIANIIAGLYWDVPMPVQPMKTIATLVGSNTLATPGAVAAAGILTGSAAFILGIFDVIRKVNQYIPRSCIAIVQCVTGIGLAQNGFTLINNLNTWTGIDSYLTAMLCSLLVILNFTNNPYRDKIPSAFLLFVIGLLLSALTVGSIPYSFVHPFSLINISSSEWKTGLLEGAIAQIPLTLLNSVVAIADLSNELFKEEIQAGVKKQMTLKSTTVSLGLCNVACIFGAIPTCHGSGGLAGQYKFGGRSGLCVVLLGILKVIIGLAGGSVFSQLLVSFPNSILGILLFICGSELTKYGMKYIKDDGFIVASGVAIGLASKIWIGFLVGIALHLLKFDKGVDNKPQREGIVEMTVAQNNAC